MRGWGSWQDAAFLDAGIICATYTCWTKSHTAHRVHFKSTSVGRIVVYTITLCLAVYVGIKYFLCVWLDWNKYKESEWRFHWLWGSLNLILMPHILPTSAIETICKETVDYYPVFYKAFSRFAPSAEMQQNALRHTYQKRRFVVLNMTDLLLSFLLSVVGSRRIFSLDSFNILCLRLN